MRDPYDVLGVSRQATDAEIKKAFRNLAKKHHPDAHANDPAKVKQFQEISSAYDILGDKEKRAQFDRGEIDAAGQPRGFDPGAQGFGGGFRPGAGGRRGRAGAQGFDFNFGGGGGEGFRTEDIFADIFGGFGGGEAGSRRRNQPRRGEDIQLATTISLEEAALGGTRRIVLGDGKELEAKIPAGVREGQTIRLKGQGGPGRNGGPPGDVLINFDIAPHALYTRDGRDLRLDLPVSLKEAVLGGKVPVQTLTGTLTLTIPPHSNSGRVLRLKGKGLPGAGSEAAGDLYVRLAVTLPDPPDPELEDFLRNSGNDYDPRSKSR
jgi:DnaJ-class molecular chaperone